MTHQLVQPLFGHAATAIRGDIHAVSITRRLAVDRDFEAHRLALHARSQHQVQVSGMEAVDNTAARSRRGGMLGANVPLPVQCPVVERQQRRHLVVGYRVGRQARCGYEMRQALIAHIGFR
ncbi:hypothetical protein D3C72_2090930 [compost metagenome]